MKLRSNNNVVSNQRREVEFRFEKGEEWLTKRLIR